MHNLVRLAAEGTSRKSDAGGLNVDEEPLIRAPSVDVSISSSSIKLLILGYLWRYKFNSAGD